MKTFIARMVLSPLIRLVDDTVPAEVLRSFLRAAFLELDAADRSAGDDVSKDLARVRDLLEGTEILPDAAELPADEARAWARRCPEGRVIRKGTLVAGSGRSLSRLDELDADDTRDFVDRNAERLLLHVESRRRQSLRDFEPAAAHSSAWIERHDVVVFFSRRARRRGDLRFLNAAFKLNDWAYPAHRRSPPAAQLARYLLALAEQERAAREVLAC